MALLVSMLRRTYGVALALTLVVLLAASARAEGEAFGLPSGVGGWAHTAEADVRLLSAVTGVASPASKDQTVLFGLHFVLKPGWKVYWRSPGDAGYPPTLDWSGSENVETAEIRWPVPHRFDIQGIQTIGYKDEVLFPLIVRPKAEGMPIRARLAVNYLICSDLCIPGKVDVSLDLPVRLAASPIAANSAVALINEEKEGLSSPAAPFIAQFLAQVPQNDPAASGIEVQKAILSATEGNQPRRLGLEVTAIPPLTSFADVMIEAQQEDQSWMLIGGSPTVTLRDGGRRAFFSSPLTSPYVEGEPLRITVTDLKRGGEVMVHPTTGDLPTETSGTSLLQDGNYWVMTGIALLGGFILNLMPCVLPVLSLKVLALIGHGGRAKKDARPVFFATSLGIIGMFAVLGIVLAGLKQAGSAVGWGIQFQQPMFLAAMILMLFVFSANLWGVFHLNLPSWLANAATLSPSMTNKPPRLLGHVFTGACATILATPCSAPFLGTAVGFALARGPVEIISIFITLGMGMASPYIVIALFPGLAGFLPKPGAWMITLRRVLALTLIGSAAWLGWVMMNVWPAEGETPPATAEVPLDGIVWQPFDPHRVRSLVDQGKVVFVDVTADWCISCKVNKAAVLDRNPVQAALLSANVVTMQADWTRPNETIAGFLAHFGRYGIPFNVVYGPAAPEGIPLPEILTRDVVLNALLKSRGVQE